MTEWQPIETAPKDGRAIRLKRVYRRAAVSDGRGYFGSVTIRYADGSDHTFRDVWVDEDGKHLFPTPTHWKQEPPK